VHGGFEKVDKAIRKVTLAWQWEALFLMGVGTCIVVIMINCCVALNKQIYLEPVLDYLFDMPPLNGADLAGITFAIIGLCAVLAFLVFHVAIWSRGVVTRELLLHVFAIEGAAAIVGIAIAFALGNVRFLTPMFLVFGAGCLIFCILLPAAAIVIAAALGSSTRPVAFLAYATTWLFLLPCSVRYKVSFTSKVRLTFLFVALAMGAQVIIEVILRCSLSDQCGTYFYPTLTRSLVLWGIVGLLLLALRQLLVLGLDFHVGSFVSTLIEPKRAPPCSSHPIGHHGCVDKDDISLEFNAIHDATELSSNRNTTIHECQCVGVSMNA
jgi:hypothetical protein